jgi:hypothetical protein
MKEEALLKIIESQQETIKELLAIIEKLSEDKEPEIRVVPMPYKDDQPNDSSPWQPSPWRPYEPYIGTPYVGDYPSTISISFKKVFDTKIDGEYSDADVPW